MSLAKEWDDIRKKIIDEKFADNLEKEEQQMQADEEIIKRITNDILTDLMGKGIDFKIEYHDINRDTAYYFYDLGDIDKGRNYIIEIPRGIEKGKENEILSDKNIVWCVKALFHEYKHLMQTENAIYKESNTEENIRFAKSLLLKEYFSEYSDVIYNNDIREIDADIYGFEQAKKYIEKHCPWVNFEKGVVEIAKEYIESSQNGKGESFYEESKSNSYEEILENLNERRNNPKNYDFPEILEGYIEDENNEIFGKESELRKSFDSIFIEKYNKCRTTREKEDLIIKKISIVYPEAKRKYINAYKDINKIKEKNNFMEKDYQKEIEENKIVQEQNEKRIQELENEIKELKKEGPKVQSKIIEKQIEIQDLIIDNLNIEEINNRNAKSQFNKSIEDKKKSNTLSKEDAKEYQEKINLYSCYSNKNYGDLVDAEMYKIDLERKLLRRKNEKEISSVEKVKENERLDNEYNMYMGQKEIYDKDLSKAIEEYSKMGGKLGENIDFSVPYYERTNEIEKEKVFKQYDIAQKFNEITDNSKIEEEFSDILTIGLAGNDEKLSEVYAKVMQLENDIPSEIIKDNNHYIAIFINEKGEEEGHVYFEAGEGKNISRLTGAEDKPKIKEVMENRNDYKKITFEQMEEQVVRSNIEKSMSDGKVNELLEVKDEKMLQYMIEKNNLEQFYDKEISPRIYLVSKQDKEGNISYEFVSHNGKDSYTKISGMNQVKDMQEYIPREVGGNASLLEKVNCQFKDEDGNDYFVSHELDQNGIILSHNRDGNIEKINTFDSGLNSKLRDSKVNELIKAGYKAYGIGNEEVYKVYNKYKQNVQQKENTNEGR